jgi:hypothetical protein
MSGGPALHDMIEICGKGCVNRFQDGQSPTISTLSLIHAQTERQPQVVCVILNSALLQLWHYILDDFLTSR